MVWKTLKQKYKCLANYLVSYFSTLGIYIYIDKSAHFILNAFISLWNWTWNSECLFWLSYPDISFNYHFFCFASSNSKFIVKTSNTSISIITQSQEKTLNKPKTIIHSLVLFACVLNTLCFHSLLWKALVKLYFFSKKKFFENFLPFWTTLLVAFQ